MRIGGLEKFTLIDFPEVMACVVYTIGCNFRCPYCHNPELVDETTKKEQDEKYLYKFLKTRHGKLDGVVITGGEPTLQKDLLEVMKKIKKMGFKVKLDSNGTNPQILEKAIKEKLVDYIAMDIKSPLAKYSSIVARSVDTKAIKKSIKIIMNSAVDYEFRTTLIKSLVPPEDIIKIGKEIKGAKKYYLQKFIPTKILNPSFRKKVTYDDEELKNIQKKLSAYVKYCGIR